MYYLHESWGLLKYHQLKYVTSSMIAVLDLLVNVQLEYSTLVNGRSNDANHLEVCLFFHLNFFFF